MLRDTLYMDHPQMLWSPPHQIHQHITTKCANSSHTPGKPISPCDAILHAQLIPNQQCQATPLKVLHSSKLSEGISNVTMVHWLATTYLVPKPVNLSALSLLWTPAWYGTKMKSVTSANTPATACAPNCLIMLTKLLSTQTRSAVLNSSQINVFVTAMISSSCCWSSLHKHRWLPGLFCHQTMWWMPRCSTDGAQQTHQCNPQHLRCSGFSFMRVLNSTSTQPSFAL